MPSLRDVANRAGVSVATASRVASGSAAVRAATRERVERAMHDLLYVRPGRLRAERRDRPARARVRQPGLRSARPGDGDAGDRRPGSPRSSATPPARRCARSTTCTCCSSGRSRDGVHLRARSPTSAASTRTTRSCWSRARGSCSSTATSESLPSRPSASTSARAGRMATEHLLEPRPSADRLRRRRGLCPRDA